MTRQLFNWTIVLMLMCESTSCNAQSEKNLPKEKLSQTKVIAVSGGQPKLIKTQGSGPGHNVRVSLQDKEGNLWFGTTGEGLYKYDGKSFIQFTSSNGLNSNLVWCLL